MIAVTALVKCFGLFTETENLQYIGHVLIYNSPKIMAKGLGFPCFIIYKMGFIFFSKHF